MNAVINYLYGSLTRHELEKYSFIALAFAAASTTYWLLISLRSALFTFFVDESSFNTAYAQVSTILVVVAIILVLSRFADKMTQYKLITGISFSYMLLFAGLALCFYHPAMSIENLDSVTSQRIFWFLWVLIESYGVVMFALLWSFFTSTLTIDSARKGLFFVVAAHYSGLILGTSLISIFFVRGLAFFLGVASMLTLCVPILLSILAHLLCGDKAECRLFEYDQYEPADFGLLGGLRQIILNPYLIGIMALIVLSHMVEHISTILNQYLHAWYVEASALPGMMYLELAQKWEIQQAALVLIFTVFAVSRMIRKGSMSSCLLLYPIAASFLFLLMYAVSLSTAVWWLLSAASIFAIALNRPAIELLYMKASMGARLKSRLWIEFFDTFFMTSLFSMVFTHQSMRTFSGVFLVVLLGLSGAWFCTAYCMGKHFDMPTEKG